MEARFGGNRGRGHRRGDRLADPRRGRSHTGDQPCRHRSARRGAGSRKCVAAQRGDAAANAQFRARKRARDGPQRAGRHGEADG